MPTWGYVIVAVAIVLVAATAVGGWLVARSRSTRLRSAFSSEYDRMVAGAGNRRQAERELRSREERHDALHIVPLRTAARERYLERWRSTQSDFVDSPETAVRTANELVEEVMGERGYPVDDFEEQAAIVSVDHPDVVEHYRAGHLVLLSAEDGRSTTEDLRRAMRHYRMLFEELLETSDDEPAEARVQETEHVT